MFNGHAFARHVASGFRLLVEHIFDLQNFDGPYWLGHLERRLSGQEGRCPAGRRQSS